jgi:ABC-2 type transport system permease protein
LASLLGAGLNVIPPTLAIVGIGTLVFGFWPRATAVATYGVLSWSVLLELAGGVVSTNHWLLDTSVFHHMASAPGESPDMTSAAFLVAIFAGTCAAGAVGFGRRDLSGE